MDKVTQSPSEIHAEAIQILDEMVDRAINALAQMEKGEQANLLTRQIEALSMAQSALKEGHRKDELVAATRLGEIVVTKTVDPEHPGVWIDLRQPGDDFSAPLCLVEYAADEVDASQPCIISRVWGDAMKEDYDTRVVHENVERFFATEDQDRNS